MITLQYFQYPIIMFCSNNTLHLPFCGKLNIDNFQEMLDSLHCMSDTAQESAGSTDLEDHCNMCFPECVEHIPYMSVSSVKWPDINHELAFYNSYIKGK